MGATNYSYFQTMPIGHVVLFICVPDYTDVTTQIWGKDFNGEMNSIVPGKSSFLRSRDVLAE
jgi:hypothetical protein